MAWFRKEKKPRQPLKARLEIPADVFEKCESCGHTDSRDAFQKQLTAAGYGTITTEIVPAPEFYYAEDYHQQYLAKNPWGYCGIGGTGVRCPAGLAHAQ